MNKNMNSKSNILKKTSNTIPLKWYFDEKYYQKELLKIWNNEWVYACHINNLNKPLSYLTLNISKYNILILKDKNNSISVYLNSCRHRGSMICKEKKGFLNNNILICPYHQWSYDASSGKLLKTSSFVVPKDFDYSKHSLKKINFKIWNGLIFINLKNKSTNWSIKKRFQDYDNVIEKINFDKFEVGHTWKKIINCNWKIFWENYSECLHCPNIHPELSNLVPVYKRRLVDIKDDPNWKKLLKNSNPKYQPGLKKGSETWSLDGSAQGHKIEYFKNNKKFPGHIYVTTWPSMFLAIFIDHVRIVRVLPISNDKTEIVAEWLFESPTIQDKSYNKSNVIDFSVLVMNQDSDACELNQKGVYNLQSEKGTLMPEEYDIKRFHDWIRSKF